MRPDAVLTLLFGCRFGYNAGLFRPRDTTPGANSVAILIQRRPTARLAGTKDISTLVPDTVTGATELFAIRIVHHSTPRRCTNNLTALVGGAACIGLATDYFSIFKPDTTAVLGEHLCRSDA